MIECSQLEQFAQKCENAANGFRPHFNQALEEIAEEFLKLVQDSIISKGNVDFGKLLASFNKGGPGNIFQIGDLQVTVGTNVEYAKWVNKGHGQQPGRFVPGVWAGGHFRYQAGARTGIVLKASFVKGSGFFDVAENGAQRLLDTYAQKAFDEFLHKYFG